MNLSEIKSLLNEKSEQSYCDFTGRLIPDSSLPLLGVRLPELKKIAAELCKNGGAAELIEACDFSSIELCLLYAYVLGRMKGEIADLLVLFDRAAAHVDNWCTCDILCQSFKQCKKHRDIVWERLEDYIATGETYRMRIAVVMMMSHFLTDDYIDRVLTVLATAENDGYYYKMGAAWCIATAMAKYRDKTLAFLRDCPLETWVYNKSIQKMLESRRISEEDKRLLRTMKRK